MRQGSVLTVLVGALLFAACEGGGGTLASDRGATTATSTNGTRAVPIERLHAPRGAAATGRTLARVEAGLRGDNRDAGTLRALGRTQQLAYRQLLAHPEWVSAALAEVPARLRAAVQANVDAGAALARLTGTAPAGLPDWSIVAPPPAATLRGYYDEAERASGISWAYLAAIHLVESRMGRIHGTSTAGAQGPMQFIPETWARYGQGGDITSDHDAILAAGRYLAASNGRANIDRALFSYNNDDRYVTAIKVYASVMLADPRAYDGYYQWQVVYATADGTFLLPEGYRGA